MQSFTAIQFIIIPQWQKYRLLHINEGIHAMLDLSELQDHKEKVFHYAPVSPAGGFAGMSEGKL